MLEAHSKGKTTDALKSLMKLNAKTATCIRAGVEQIVPIEEVCVGDVFVVRPGETIPVDGTIVSGTGAVDESSLTGESIPVDKVDGQMVYAGTLNQSGFFQCEATKVGKDTTLSQIIQMVRDAAASKAPIAKVADRVSGIFVPTVMVLALATCVIWLFVGESVGFALARAISVLVISCPCALGLATPVAIMVGNGVGARNGILFKTAVSLEQTGRAKIVALDKTGTITKGKPVVTDVEPMDGISHGELLSLAAALEAKSEHPLAKAVHTYTQEKGVEASEVEGFQALPGNGVTATIHGEVCFAGSFSFIQTKAIVSKKLQDAYERLTAEGKTPLFFTKGEALYGMIAVADVIKEDSVQAIAQLRRMGIHTVMLTGDNERTAQAIAKQAGVDQVVAGVLPDGKANVVRTLQEQGAVVMVGDGINDAPALTSAEVGMAIGAGTDVAMDAADVVLMKSRLSDVVAAIQLSRATLRNIHQNLFWAFFYNVIGIPLAAGVFIRVLGWQLNPMFAAAAMSLSSFCVVTNALRLNFVRLYRYEEKSNTTEQKVQVMGENTDLKKEKKEMKKTMKIEGMMCGHCEAHVKKALENLSEVTAAEVSHVNGEAHVTLLAEISDEVLRKTVEEEGYQVVAIQ
jgi:Cu2+-exporting ATPase